MIATTLFLWKKKIKNISWIKALLEITHSYKIDKFWEQFFRSDSMFNKSNVAQGKSQSLCCSIHLKWGKIISELG